MLYWPKEASTDCGEPPADVPDVPTGNEVPGVTVPPAVLERMRRASEQSKEHALAEGIAIARESLARVQGAVQGVQVSAPFGRIELAVEVLSR